MATFSRHAPETEVNSPAVNAKGDFDGAVSLPGGSAAVYTACRDGPFVRGIVSAWTTDRTRAIST